MRRGLSAASVAVLLFSCAQASEETNTSQAQPKRQEPAETRRPPEPTGPQPYVVIESGGKEHKVAVEVVRTQRDIRRGMMYRTYLAEDAGMLFLFDREKFQSFWMKNCLIPLDMIFINANMKIAGIVENAEPRTTTSRKVPAPSQYVLEVNGGWSKKRGIRALDKVRFVDVANVPPPVPLGQKPSKSP